MNKNYKHRDELLKPFFCESSEKDYDILRFDNLTLEVFGDLIYYQYVELNGCFNSSPTTLQFFNFMAKYPKIMAHGYVVTPKRQDCRITIEGLEGQGKFGQKINDLWSWKF